MNLEPRKIGGGMVHCSSHGEWEAEASEQEEEGVRVTRVEIDEGRKRKKRLSGPQWPTWRSELEGRVGCQVQLGRGAIMLIGFDARYRDVDSMVEVVVMRMMRHGWVRWIKGETPP